MRRDPTELRRALMRIAAQQAGYFSAAQAVEVGYSYQVQWYHVHRNDWLRIDRGIYRLPDWPAGQHEDLVRWTLWSRGRAVVSHETDLAVHQLADMMPARVHISFPFFFQAEDGIRDFHVTGVQTCALPISVRGGQQEPQRGTGSGEVERLA